jgi:lipopolysaccharide export system permease protein
MRLLDRYLLRELLVPLGYCFAGFLIFWISSDLIAQLDEFNAEQLNPRQIALYYLVKIPDFIVLVGPIALLLALLYTTTHLARHNEITAMRSAGRSLWRISLPYLLTGLALSALLAVINDVIAPAGAAVAERLRAPKVAGTDPRDADWVSNLNFKNERENRTWSMQAYNTRTGEMRQPRLFWQLPDGSRRDITAATGRYVDGAWRFEDVQEIFYPADPAALPVPSEKEFLVFDDLKETPAHVASEIKISSISGIKAARKVELTTAEILHYLHLHRDLPDRDYALLHTQLHVRLAMPWTALVVVLVAIPFGAASGRRNVFVGVASSIFLAFGFFAMQRIGMALGVGGHLPPVIAGWAPNILCGGWGAWLLARVR